MLLLGEYPLSQSLLSCCFIYKPLASLQSLSAFTSELDMKHFTGIIHPNLPHSCDSHHREMGLILYSIHFCVLTIFNYFITFSCHQQCSHITCGRHARRLCLQIKLFWSVSFHVMKMQNLYPTNIYGYTVIIY